MIYILNNNQNTKFNKTQHHQNNLANNTKTKSFQAYLKTIN